MNTRLRFWTASLFVGLASASILATHCSAQWTQQGTKLVATGSVGAAQRGTSVVISADGNTALVGGPNDNNMVGCVWVYTRSGESWTQQGSRLVGTGASSAVFQGNSVALSGDGNTALVGSLGATWAFTRSGSTWSQQGSPMIGSNWIGSGVDQGRSVAISADGNTALIGGPADNSNIGAAWVFTRSGGTWSQQGSKLVGAGSTGTLVQQGTSVALSADGNTAFVGAPSDNNGAGAVWIYTRSGSTWTQLGTKLLCTNNTGLASFGRCLALSTDGNTLAVGGSGDNNSTGAVFVFTKTGSTWTQQAKLVGSGASGTNVQQGWSVSITSDGNRLIEGGFLDAGGAGAAWPFVRSGSTWSQDGNKLVGTGSSGNAWQGYGVAISADGARALVGGLLDASNTGAVWAFARSGTSAVTPGVSPVLFALHQNFPNPFNPETVIEFSVENTERATLEVFDMLGRHVVTLFDGLAEAGRNYSLKMSGANLTSGVYFYRLQSDKRSENKRMLLLK